MGRRVDQGDIIKTDRYAMPVLVVSKNFFNESGRIIGCPIMKEVAEGPLHLQIETKKVKGYVLCEELKMLDLKLRRYQIMDRISMNDIVNVTDAIQGIFDYV